MSTINSKAVQVGTSGTANQNFTLYQPASPDGTVRLGVGNSGATTLDAVTVTSAGNVGIGTSAPERSLDVRRASSVGEVGAFLGNTAASTAGNTSSLWFGTWSGASTNNIYNAKISAVNTDAGSAASALAFWTYNGSGSSSGVTERMRITFDGNVGIGTSSPGAKLDVNGSSRLSGNVTLADYANIGATNNNAGISLTGGSATNNGGQINLRGGSFGTANAIEFIQGGTEQARIDTGGVFKFNSGYGSVATAYGCRAWVNFNGTGTVAIRGSGNVSSITDNGTGNYTVNFTTAMPDVNYCPVFGAEGGFDVQRYQTNGAQNTGNYQVLTGFQASSGALIQADIGTVLVAIFR